MRQVLVGVLLILFAVGARAQAPMAVSAQKMSEHLLKQVPLVYPAQAKAEGVTGTVVLLIEVSAAGRVDRTRVLSGPPMLRAAARQNVGQWVFRPFTKNGQAMAAAGLVQVVFQPDAGPTPVVEFLTRARAKYATEPGLAAEGFHCRVEPAWREFPQVERVASDSPLVTRLKRTRVRLVVATTGAAMTAVKIPKKPKLNLQELTAANELVTMTRQMLDGFFMTWLPFAVRGPGAPPDAQVKTTGAGTVIEYEQGGVTDWMSFDGNLRMLHYTELLPSGEAIEQTPVFAAGPDGLLLYTGADFAMHQGDATTHGAYRIEYQEVDGYRLPKVVEIKAGKSLDVHFRLRGCKIGQPAVKRPRIDRRGSRA